MLLASDVSQTEANKKTTTATEVLHDIHLVLMNAEYELHYYLPLLVNKDSQNNLNANFSVVDVESRLPT